MWRCSCGDTACGDTRPREADCWRAAGCVLCIGTRGARLDHRGARRGHSAPVATRLHASSQGVRNSSTGEALGPLVSGLRARPPPPSARAPRHSTLRGRPLVPTTHRDPASRAAPRRAQHPASSKCVQPTLAGRAPSRVRARTCWVLLAAYPDGRDAYQEAGVSRRRGRWRVAPRRGGRASQPYTEFGTRRLEACKRLRRRRRDAPADKTAIPIVSTQQPAPSSAANLRQRVPDQLSRALGTPVRVERRAHGLVRIRQRVA